MPTDLEKLLANLRVEQVNKFLFVGKSPQHPPRVFGGQVLAQALNAAIRTVAPERTAHSMHAYFLRPGDPSTQIVYEVDPIRDGRSFTTRRVVAKQGGKAIFNASISFQLPEVGMEHQLQCPSAVDPESLPSDRDYWNQLADSQPERYQRPASWAIERKPVQRRNFLHPEQDIGEPRQAYWMKALGELEDDTIVHQTLLAYMSDMTLMGAALRPHPVSTRSEHLSFASLDHALWFHRPLRADQWLLYDQDSPVALACRGFTRGSFYTRQGQLVASVAQEILMRERSQQRRD